MASSCSSVMLGSGGNARCTVCISLSWILMVIESGILIPNSWLHSSLRIREKLLPEIRVHGGFLNDLLKHFIATSHGNRLRA